MYNKLEFQDRLEKPNTVLVDKFNKLIKYFFEQNMIWVEFDDEVREVKNINNHGVEDDEDDAKRLLKVDNIDLKKCVQLLNKPTDYGEFFKVFVHKERRDEIRGFDPRRPDGRAPSPPPPPLPLEWAEWGGDNGGGEFRYRSDGRPSKEDKQKYWWAPNADPYVSKTGEFVKLNANDAPGEIKYRYQKWNSNLKIKKIHIADVRMNGTNTGIDINVIHTWKWEKIKNKIDIGNIDKRVKNNIEKSGKKGKKGQTEIQFSDNFKFKLGYYLINTKNEPDQNKDNYKFNPEFDHFKQNIYNLIYLHLVFSKKTIPYTSFMKTDIKYNKLIKKILND